MAQDMSDQGDEDFCDSLGKLELCEIMRNSTVIEGSIKRCILKTRTLIDGEKLRREMFGEKDPAKLHKTILLVGETGSGKSTLINAMVNYALDVQVNDGMWCEIVESKEDQTDSQTTAVTVYDVFAEKSPFSLSIIDTPGYGNTEGIEEDCKIAETLHELFKSSDGVQKLDAVCLVVPSSTKRLKQSDLYVFDAILSLFGKDVENNVVVLITDAPDEPSNTIKAILKSKVKCAKIREEMPVYFRFDNSHCETLQVGGGDQKTLKKFEEVCAVNEASMKNFFVFLNETKAIDLKQTVSVLKKRKQLTGTINNLKDRITLLDLKHKELKQTKDALELHERERKENNNFEYEVDEPYKIKVPKTSAWWWWSKEATCCSVCEENCHYPGCWWVRDLSRCSVMKDGKCTVCTGRCDYTHHIKEGKIYEQKTRRVKRTYEDLKKEYEEKYGKKTNLKSLLDDEIKEQETEKYKLVDKSYECVVILEEIALKTDSMYTLQHLDFLIEKVKETERHERVKKLDELKKRAEDENPGVMKRLKRLWPM